MADLDVTQVDAIQDLAPKWRYVIYLPDLPNHPAPDPMLVSSPQINHMHVGLNQQFQGSEYVSYPNFMQSATLSCEFNEPSSFGTREYFIAWRKLVVDPEGMYWGLPEGENGYKRSIYIQQYDILGKLRSTITFGEATPDGPVSEPLGEESNFISYSMTFSIGYAKTVVNS